MAVGGSSLLAQCPPCLQASYPDERRGGILFGKRKPKRLHSNTIKLQRHREELGHVSWNTTSAGTAATVSSLPIKRSHQPQTCTGAGGCCRGFPGSPSHPDPCTFRSTFPLKPTCPLTSFPPSPPASERHLHWVKANFNTLRPPAATCSLSICTISWSCGSEHPWSQSTQDLPAA